MSRPAPARVLPPRWPPSLKKQDFRPAAPRACRAAALDERRARRAKSAMSRVCVPRRIVIGIFDSECELLSLSDSFFTSSLSVPVPGTSVSLHTMSHCSFSAENPYCERCEAFLTCIRVTWVGAGKRIERTVFSTRTLPVAGHPGFASGPSSLGMTEITSFN